MKCDNCRLTGKCSTYFVIEKTLQELEMRILDEYNVDLDCDYQVVDCPRFRLGEPTKVIGFLDFDLEEQYEPEGEDEPDDNLS